MMTKNKVALLITCIALAACDTKEEDKNRCEEHPFDTSCIEEIEPQNGVISENDLLGKAFVDDIGNGQFVIISFYPDKTYSEVGNDNYDLSTRQAFGSWDLSGTDISVSLTDESFVFREAEMTGEILSFRLPEKDEFVYLQPNLMPSVSELGKEFYFSDCQICTLSFNEDFTGDSSGDGDGSYPFVWSYVSDGSVEINFTQGQGTVRYFFTEKSGGELHFVAYSNFSDEPEGYLEKGRLIPN